ncbi:hypothetical protein PHYC_00252 [Phycisphaerales bacterium]|nr:hypothetical protein PHYC_00252 [Phycisphaerales bacterium]
MSPSRIVSAGVLTAIAGLPLSAAASIFTFSPVCNNNWYAECNNGQPCTGGGWQTFNNWGQSGCAGGLPTPGPTDDVEIGTNTLVLNGDVLINSLSNPAGGTLSWSYGRLAITLPFTNLGDVIVEGNNKNLAADVVNEGTITARNSWNLYLENAAITNNAMFRLSGSKDFYPASGSTDNSFDNAGTVSKVDGGTALWSGMPFNSTGLVESISGTLQFSEASITSSAGATWSANGGAFQFLSCSMSGAFDIVNNGTVEVYNGWTMPADVTLNATQGGLNWINGNLSIAPGAVLTNAPTGILYVGGNNKTLSGAVLNQGEIVALNSWNLYFSDATVTNSGTLRLSGSKHILSGGGTNLFINTGTVTKTDGGTATWTAIPFDTTGTVSAVSGTIDFQSTPITSSAAASWNLTGGTIRFFGCSLADTFVFENTGVLEVHNGWTIPSDTTLAAKGNGLNWIDGNLTISPDATLVNAPESALYIGGNNKVLSGNLLNQGEIVAYNSWNLYFSNAAVTNPGTLRLSGSKDLLESASTTNSFANPGLITKTDGGTAEWHGIPLNTSGTISSVVGTLHFRAAPIASSPAARWTVGAAALRFYDNCSLAGTFDIDNAGTLEVHSGWTIPGDTTITATGNGLAWVSGTLTIAGGASLTNGAGGTLSIVGNNKTLTGSLRNLGTTVLTDSWNLYLADAVLTNSGILDFSGSKDVYGTSGTSALVTNLGSGLVRKSGGGTGLVDVPFTNAGLISIESGTFRISNAFAQQPGGVTRLAGGTLRLDSGTIFDHGRIEGYGPVTGSVITVAATTAPGGFSAAGTLNISGSFTQNPTSKTEIKIGGLGEAEFDRITANTASLGGTLFVRFFNGFRPMAGDTFTFLFTTNPTGRSGEFANYTLLDPLEGLVITVDYAANSATVRVIQCTPCLPCDGDINCDGALNGFDIETMEQAVNGDLSNFCQPDPDFNHDGAVNGFDVEVIEQVVNGGFCP